ncbi:hypothetical protein [Halostella sp. PRR32]|uniref:hypothetical protein n=1 Tax=Halostella sp. PRR32 TaxID=3098147 RepID=UPI002B1DC76C|nr:hypothetical protein [Halostella sp. PRR32]
MTAKNNRPTVEDKRNRIKTLVQELYSRDYQTFLEIQFQSQEGVYQSYPNEHNITGLNAPQREPLHQIIQNYELEITFEETIDESSTVTAHQNPESPVDDHMEVLEAIIKDVYGAKFEGIKLAFLSSSGPENPEPLLWTDLNTS